MNLKPRGISVSLDGTTNPEEKRLTIRCTVNLPKKSRKKLEEQLTKMMADLDLLYVFSNNGKILRRC